MRAVVPYVDFLGENKVQEAVSKRTHGGLGQIKWRLIGPLQRNKARKALEIFDTIDSVDSRELIETLERILRESKIQTENVLGNSAPFHILLEINTSGEANKTGCAPEDAGILADFVLNCSQLVLDGLMTLGPLGGNGEGARKAFARLRNIRDELRRRTGLPLPVLSMGMSGDFREAVLEGATQVRIGTALFGPR
jgi:pyridoxal phosphate enzyme (YggS family)